MGRRMQIHGVFKVFKTDKASAIFQFKASDFLKLALIGFVFLGPKGGFILINLCDKYSCVHFWPFGNWV